MGSSTRFNPAKRGIAIAMACVITLAGCSGPVGSPPLSPAQQQLKQANDRFNTTVVEGAVIGGAVLGVAGGVLGAVLCGKNCALLGLAAGAAVGAAAGAAKGYDVARKNYTQARTEDNLKRLIAESNQDADAFHRSAVASRDIAAEARTKIAALDEQYKAKTITADQYKQGASSYRASADIITTQLASTTQKMATMRADAATQSGSDQSTLLDDARQIEEARRALKESSESLAATLAMVPS